MNEKDQADVKRINAQALYALAQALDPMSPIAGEVSVQQVIEEIMGMKHKPEMVDEADLATRILDAQTVKEKPRANSPEDSSPSVD